MGRERKAYGYMGRKVTIGHGYEAAWSHYRYRKWGTGIIYLDYYPLHLIGGKEARVRAGRPLGSCSQQASWEQWKEWRWESFIFKAALPTGFPLCLEPPLPRWHPGSLPYFFRSLLTLDWSHPFEKAPCHPSLLFFLLSTYPELRYSNFPGFVYDGQ